MQNNPDILSDVAPAKINLFLHVTGARPDGYHTLNSIVTFTTDGDKIILTKGEGEFDSLNVTGDFSKKCPTGDNNLIIEAAKLMRTHFKKLSEPSVHFELHKNLPIASGIGGGSSNAATVMKLLNTFWKLDASHEELAEIGLKLGADVPMCLYGKRCFISGIGEEITPVSVEGDSYDIVLINALKPVSTPSVFKAYDRLQGAYDAPSTSAGKKKYVSYYNHASSDKPKNDTANKTEFSNHLTPAAISICPIIQDVLELTEKAEGVKLSSMSGSGGTVFAIMTSQDSAAALALSARKKGWWVMQTSLKL